MGAHAFCEDCEQEPGVSSAGAARATSMEDLHEKDDLFAVGARSVGVLSLPPLISASPFLIPNLQPSNLPTFQRFTIPFERY
jgi:hypothetical protein